MNGEFAGVVSGGCTDHGAFALLGWNVNQPPPTSTASLGAPGTWTVPSSGGITITFTSTAPAGSLRVQLQEAGTNLTSLQRYCAPITSGALVPWSAITTECWGGAGTTQTAATGVEIQQAMLEVFQQTTPTTFDVCIENIVVTTS
jgi:hypothetical protein